jgi:hypothetical protein
MGILPMSGDFSGPRAGLSLILYPTSLIVAHSVEGEVREGLATPVGVPTEPRPGARAPVKTECNKPWRYGAGCAFVRFHVPLF